ncbi:MAG: hypothetical protein F9K46_06140 [Anaerolineae bacterium]|nr:MAG: hypothetical protein F9K46_06140 [Anaerolineae bacterium]
MSSEDGLVWLIGYGHDWAKNTFTQLDSIGNVSPILMDWLSNGEAVIQDNFIIAFDKYCGSYCSIRLYPLNGYDARRVVLPPQVSPPFYFFDAFSDDSFLIQDYVGETLWAWLRTADNRWLSLGIIGTQDWNTIRVQSIHDDQWALALVDEYYYYKLRLWNLRRAEIAFEIRVEKSLDHYDVWSSGDSVLIRRNNEAWKFYSAAENKLINVENFQDSKFQILPNGQLLYQAPEGGIYLVDAKTELTTLLVPNGYMASRHWLYQ